MSGALEGLKIIELGQMVSAPYCAKLFADFGADVIKVEPPGGDEEIVLLLASPPQRPIRAPAYRTGAGSRAEESPWPERIAFARRGELFR